MSAVQNKLELEEKYKRYLIKAIGHLEKSYAKSLKLGTILDQLTDDELEIWESFTSRFTRVVDLYLTKYLRVLILKQDPGFEGTLKDHLNYAEKNGWISSAELFLSFREYRNIQAHDYTEESFSTFVNGLRMQTPELLKIKENLIK